VSISTTKGRNTVNVDVENHHLTPGVYFTKISIWDKKMLHPFVVKKQGIFTVEADHLLHHMNAVFVPQTTWKSSEMRGDA